MEINIPQLEYLLNILGVQMISQEWKINSKIKLSINSSFIILNSQFWNFEIPYRNILPIISMTSFLYSLGELHRSKNKIVKIIGLL